MLSEEDGQWNSFIDLIRLLDDLNIVDWDHIDFGAFIRWLDGGERR